MTGRWWDRRLRRAGPRTHEWRGEWDAAAQCWRRPTRDGRWYAVALALAFVAWVVGRMLG